MLAFITPLKLPPINPLELPGRGSIPVGALARAVPAPYTPRMKLWRAGTGSLFALMLACGGRAGGGDSDGPLAPEPTSNGPATAPPSAPPPAYQRNTAPPPASTAPPDRAPPSESETEAQIVEGMLGRYCGECHGVAAIRNGNVMSAFDFVEDIDELVANGYIVPLNADASPLFARIRRGDMPPPGVQPRPSQTEIRAFESFIDADDQFWGDARER